jgi:nucleotide-binding universal stress UspA family protein
MKTIIVATDFSPAALNAAYYAADMAIAANMDLLLLHTFNIAVVYGEIPIVMSEEDMYQDAEKDILQLKEQLEQKTAGKLSINTEVRMGIFFNELKTVCEKVKPYTVVMGSQGTTATDRFILGGHTVHAMKHLPWPLVTVPNDASFSALKKVGLAVDFKNTLSQVPVEAIKNLVNDFHASLHILNIGHKETFEAGTVFNATELDDMFAPIKPDFHFVSHEYTDEGLIDVAEKNDIDLLIVLPMHHGLLDKVFHKSNTKKLVLHSPVPVMAFHV